MSTDAVKTVRSGQVLGLGSGRAATAFVKALAHRVRAGKLDVVGVPTSLQIKMVAQQEGIQLAEIEQTGHVDAIFDGADQIDSKGFLIKGGGGALMRENILASVAEKVVIMADSSKFVRSLTLPIPLEVHPSARTTVQNRIKKMGGLPKIRRLEREYPFITENGNIIIDCSFGTVTEPAQLRERIIRTPGVLECGIFTRVPDVVYRANADGSFDTMP